MAEKEVEVTMSLIWVPGTVKHGDKKEEEIYLPALDLPSANQLEVHFPPDLKSLAYARVTIFHLGGEGNGLAISVPSHLKTLSIPRSPPLPRLEIDAGDSSSATGTIPRHDVPNKRTGPFDVAYFDKSSGKGEIRRFHRAQMLDKVEHDAPAPMFPDDHEAVLWLGDNIAFLRFGPGYDDDEFDALFKHARKYAEARGCPLYYY